METQFYYYDILIPRGAFEREIRNRGAKIITHRPCLKYVHGPSVYRSNHPIKDGYRETIHTPCGDISHAFLYNTRRLIEPDGDIQIEWPIKTIDDFKPLTYMIKDHIETGGINMIDENDFIAADLGDDGMVTTSCEFAPTVTARHLLGLECWSYAQYDWPYEYSLLMESIDDKNQLQFKTAQLLKPGTIVIVGNIQDPISPNICRIYELPYFRKYGPTLHDKGLILGVHAHASRLSLYKDIIKEMNIDWVESFTPPPFGDLSLEDARACWGEKVFIWINFPEVVFYQGYDATIKYTRELLKSDSCKNRAIGFGEMGMMGVDERTREIFQTGIRAIFDALEEE